MKKRNRLLSLLLSAVLLISLVPAVLAADPDPDPTEIAPAAKDDTPAPEDHSALFFIRREKTIPMENGTTDYPASSYTKASAKLQGRIRGPIFDAQLKGSPDKLDADRLIAHFDHVRKDFIVHGTEPDGDAIKSALETAHVPFNPDTEAIGWYVVKKADTPDFPGFHYHVDGVIYPKEASYLLTYNLNADKGTATGILPDPALYRQDADATVQFPTLTREGYRFLGWSEDSTASSPTYPVSTTLPTISMTGNKHLYAIWAPATTTFSVWHYYLAGEARLDTTIGYKSLWWYDKSITADYAEGLHNVDRETVENVEADILTDGGTYHSAGQEFWVTPIGQKFQKIALNDENYLDLASTVDARIHLKYDVYYPVTAEIDHGGTYEILSTESGLDDDPADNQYLRSAKLTVSYRPAPFYHVVSITDNEEVLDLTAENTLVIDELVGQHHFVITTKHDDYTLTVKHIAVDQSGEDVKPSITEKAIVLPYDVDYMSQVGNTLLPDALTASGYPGYKLLGNCTVSKISETCDIEVLFRYGPQATPEPSPEVSPSPTPTDKPEPSPEVSPSPVPTDKPEPSPEVSPSPVPTDKPEPSPEVPPSPVPTDRPPQPTSRPEPPAPTVRPAEPTAAPKVPTVVPTDSPVTPVPPVEPTPVPQMNPEPRTPIDPATLGDLPKTGLTDPSAGPVVGGTLLGLSALLTAAGIFFKKRSQSK